ncbi:MAG: hypothetical protein ACKO41_04755 [Sphingomonadales bacterium]
MAKLSPRILSVLVVLLLLVNSGLVIYLFMERTQSQHRHTTAHRDDAFERMASTLGYSDAQKEQHRTLRTAHSSRVRSLYDSVRYAKVLLYSRNSIVEESDSVFINYMTKMSQWQTSINQLNYAYYKEVRRLLRPEQQPRYDSMLVKMIERGRRDSSGQR